VSAKNVTSDDAHARDRIVPDSAWRIRDGVLADGVTIQFNTTSHDWWVSYRGTLAALLASGALTQAALTLREARRRGQRLVDEHGRRFKLHHLARGRYELTKRSDDPCVVESWPGVMRLYPTIDAEVGAAFERMRRPS
jgi:hypothetical protein